MKQDRIQKPTGMIVLALLCLSTLALKPGGDSFEVFLNQKLLFKQFVHQSQSLQNISFAKVGANDQLTVYYHHCGQTGKSRSLILQDAKGHALKEWKFADAQDVDQGMSLKVKDILQVTKGGAGWSLVYRSRELPAGKALASIDLPSRNVAAVNSFEFVVCGL
ncbi:MAG: hypothetical protein ACJ75B_12055 [Flavisolibacter sp.]|jgi:hypothetical protein